MDSASHLLIGVTLGGLALALSDPAIGSHSSVMYGLFAATIVGSNAPDFDVAIRIRGHESYLLHHRGFSHSLPMLAMWPVLIAPLLAYLFHAWDYVLLLFLWTMAGVMLHVFLDFFNAYGVQCFRPISKKWFHGDAIPIFDPIIFGLHLAGVLVWLFGVMAATVVFPLLYGVTFLFIGYRIVLHRLMLRKVRRRYGTSGHSFLIPKWLPHRWGYVHEADHVYIAGSIRGALLKEETRFQKGEQNDIVQAVMGSDGVRSFLSFAHRVHITCQRIQNGYKVELRDVRFRHGEKLAFGMDVTLDDHLQVTGNTIGWKKKPWEPPFA
ncbi:metal-dependent hydrolase [Paenibacillus sp. NEAU-GSW1]|uniref:metal-dependent hydrolase n=1 Tax=Paenibacillus sp. NEAU-GSW1 TaxID=2682486 RepID=UPI0012E2C08E|nr:metal-dependent hydrolase [Paenibacillus sp. NEAU-GSW1]MUT64703.1 metal-dependent hydrolase [Paenibacillus sp. NEAU-GSW1]